MKEQQAIFFSPHQDDELLTMGISILKHGGCDSHVVLFVDGAQSGVKRILRNGRRCAWHDNWHLYPLTISSFVSARDSEFRDSCVALGISDSNIHIDSLRPTDGIIDVKTAKKVMMEYVGRFPGACVKTLTPYAGVRQHPDHKALGLAAVELYGEGVIKDLELFCEPYYVDDFREANPGITLYEHELDTEDEAIKKRLQKAIDSYRKWAPAEKRYAIGYHSVADYFRSLETNPRAFSHRI